jgi:DNA-binding MarR family transcriptional regulator
VTTATTATIDATELAARLRLGVTRLARRLRQETDADVTPSQLAALSTIERHQPMTVGDLSAHERVQPPTMTRVISALVDSGFVAREPDPSDRRVAWLRLSPEGARFLARGRTRKEAYLAKRLRRIEPDRLVILEQAVDLLEELVEEDGR